MDVIDPILVPSALKLGIQPGGDDRLRHLDTDNASTESDDIRIIVLLGQSGRYRLTADRRADALYFVCRQRDTDTRPTDQNAAVRLTGSHCFTDFLSVLRVVAANIRIGSEIDDLMSFFLKKGRDLFLYSTAE